MQFWMFPWYHEAFDFFHQCQEREGSYIGGWFAAAAIGTERLSVLEDLREVWAKQRTMEERFLTPFLPGLLFPREAMLLRALKDAGDPWIT
jgi:hypothetical protein